ncbi:helix-turn-helix domain-containing protein [Streptomyces sp. MNU76]|uniref:ArsR/SmtB family transcription factor n=1 Tax=Streptomyces sp. MNU76 TaxID=2560026 RepID=UPI001E3D8BE9|nr:helix-turn-helix domain-containing protein [Streptomyces sp. MNU76]MCC9707850.1 helix-turn-helix domain-containing protein [Streptomyces sp. MNU76]
MLRIHFGPEDLGRVTVATGPDPLWELVTSLHRLRSRAGRWAYAEWHRDARAGLAGTALGRAVGKVLMPVLPRAVYFPDFVTPPEAGAGFEQGLAAILDTPRERIRHEIRTLHRLVGAPAWTAGLAEPDRLREFTDVLRAYHDAVIAPHHDVMRSRVDSERALRTRAFLDGGVDGLLSSMAPGIRWRPPVLEVDYCEDRDLHLGGRGLRLLPSYFCWRTPTSLADPELPPTLAYPLLHERTSAPERPTDASLATLLGRTRAAALRTLAHGATTCELARILGISPATATHHTTVLRDAGLVTSLRRSNKVLHTLTPTGAALLGRDRCEQRVSRRVESRGSAAGPAGTVEAC